MVPSQGVNRGTNQGMLPNYELLDANFHCNFEANGEEQFDINWLDALGPGEQALDFNECLENTLRLGLVYLQSDYGSDDMASDEFDLNPEMDRVYSMLFEVPDGLIPSPIFDSYTETYGMGDVAMGSSDQTTLQEDMYQTTDGDLDIPRAASLVAQREARTKRVRKPRDKTPPLSLDGIFATFHSSEDILHQSNSPQHNQTGLDLVEQLISELGLALRLSGLHDRWRKM